MRRDVLCSGYNPLDAFLIHLAHDDPVLGYSTCPMTCTAWPELESGTDGAVHEMGQSTFDKDFEYEATGAAQRAEQRSAVG